MATYDLLTSSPALGATLAANDIITCAYSGVKQSVLLPAGKYKLQCWGAQGGLGYGSSVGGKGGYAIGTITLSQTTELFLYVGECPGGGTTIKTSGGFNGGGAGNSRRSDNSGGGGGTDIRVGTDSLYARVIVAGGGGGGNSPGTTGIGGGTSGVGNTTYCGTQTSAGSGGSFGKGADINVNGGYPTGGAGGGWYGGGGITDGSSSYAGNGGGSGYVYTSGTAGNYPSGCLLNSKYYLASASTTAGNSSFVAPTSGNETGHSGDGYIKITVVSISGTISGLYDIGVSASPASTTIKTGDIIYCSYSGSAKNITLPIGEYKLECWGAQGGAGYDGGTQSIGGKGGYSTGILTLDTRTTIYLYTGGQGSRGYTTTGLVAGGWNGGGAGCITSANNITYSKGSGGGASDIRIGSTTTNYRIIVAGGGGGGSRQKVGGAGGGTTGADGVAVSYAGGTGGTASAAGVSYYNGATGNTTYITEAKFGTGGAAKTTGANCAGGGGGWYGGGASSSTITQSQPGSGGGGSGHVYTSFTANDYPSTKPNTKYYLGSASTIQDVQSGNGLIKITVLAAYQPVTIPTLSNTSKTYNGSAQSPTERNYDTTKMTRSGTFSATMPGTYNVIYSLKDGYIWSDGSLTSKTYAWEIASNWKKVQPWIFDSTM